MTPPDPVEQQIEEIMARAEAAADAFASNDWALWVEKFQDKIREPLRDLLAAHQDERARYENAQCITCAKDLAMAGAGSEPADSHPLVASAAPGWQPSGDEFNVSLAERVRDDIACGRWKVLALVSKALHESLVKLEMIDAPTEAVVVICEKLPAPPGAASPSQEPTKS